MSWRCGARRVSAQRVTPDVDNIDASVPTAMCVTNCPIALGRTDWLKLGSLKGRRGISEGLSLAGPDTTTRCRVIGAQNGTPECANDCGNHNDARNRNFQNSG